MLAITIILLHYLDILFTILSRRDENSWNSCNSVQPSHIHGRAEARKSARAVYLPAGPESGEPSTLPISPSFWPRWATLLVCFLVLSACTHTEQTGWDILWGCRTREPACFKPSEGEVYVQELRHFVLTSTWPLTTVYTSEVSPSSHVAEHQGKPMKVQNVSQLNHFCMSST